MDEPRSEAEEWVAHEVQRLRGLPYDELAGREGESRNEELRTLSGETLIMQTQIVRDPVTGEELRVVVEVSPPGADSDDSVAKDEFVRGPDTGDDG